MLFRFFIRPHLSLFVIRLKKPTDHWLPIQFSTNDLLVAWDGWRMVTNKKAKQHLNYYKTFFLGMDSRINDTNATQDRFNWLGHLNALPQKMMAVAGLNILDGWDLCFSLWGTLAELQFFTLRSLTEKETELCPLVFQRPSLLYHVPNNHQFLLIRLPNSTQCFLKGRFMEVKYIFFCDDIYIS